MSYKEIHWLRIYLFIICLDYILKHSIDDNINLGFTLSQRRSSRHPAIHITDIDYADDIAVTADTIKDAEKMLHQIEEAAEDIGLKINSDKTEYMSLNSKSDNMISRNGNSIKNVDNFKYLGSYIANTENDINTRIAKAWAALNSMIILWKSNLSENLKSSFFRAAVESVLVYGATTWTLTATLEKDWMEHILACSVLHSINPGKITSLTKTSILKSQEYQPLFGNNAYDLQAIVGEAKMS